MNKPRYFFSILVLAALLLSSCQPIQAPSSTTETSVAAASWTAPKNALVSVKVSETPQLDGVMEPAIWSDAPVLTIKLAHGANVEKTTAELRSVYTSDRVYFLLTYLDPTESQQRSPWKLGDDGKWTKLVDPNDKGGDNNIFYEDKFSLMWTINNSVEKFDAKGCFTACHTKDDTGKPYGNKFFENEGAMADLWHWKSVRNLNQVDDQYVDTTPYDKEKAPEAGRHSDPKDGGGYADNLTEDKSGPMYGLPSNKPAPPYSIIDEEKVPLDATLYKPGDEVPGIIKSMITGDRGDITAGWLYADGQWTIEFGRKLVTGSQYDVQFSDLANTYYFGLAVFDNAQVRHAFADRPNSFVFQP